jgi:hypothetical protein
LQPKQCLIKVGSKYRESRINHAFIRPQNIHLTIQKTIKILDGIYLSDHSNCPCYVIWSEKLKVEIILYEVLFKNFQMSETDIDFFQGIFDQT